MLCSALPSETLGGPEVGACQACCCFPIVFLYFVESDDARPCLGATEIARIFKRREENAVFVLRVVVVHQYMAASPV